MALSPGEGLKAILADAGFTNDGYQVFVGKMPPKPDKAVAIRHTPGRSGEVAVAIDYPSVQLIARGEPEEYADTYQKLVQAKQALVRIPSGPAAYPELTSCVARGDIQDLGYDDNNRPMFSLNLNLIVSYASDGYRE